MAACPDVLTGDLLWEHCDKARHASPLGGEPQPGWKSLAPKATMASFIVDEGFLRRRGSRR